ncbi:MAG: HEAT repeat domain-containing protein [Acidobacteria bacterium]|nr:HEAT repeat domain-containing protein [Acidobacteriota bacterium]
MRRVGSLGIALLVTMHCVAAQRLSTQQQIDLLIRSRVDTKAFAQAALEAGPALISPLRQLLKRTKSIEERNVALGALVYIGGDAAVSVIQKAPLTNTDLKHVMALALASSNSPRNRKVLMSFLDEDYYEHWQLVQQAALSLGVMRANEAIPALEMAAQKRPQTFPSSAAYEALRWIKKGYWEVTASISNEQHRAVAAVLRNGIPSTHEGRCYADARNGFWCFDANGWNYTVARPERELAGTLSFEIFVNSDISRALASVGFHCGLLCGEGYEFVLRKDNREWKVQGIRLAWVS